LLVIVFCLADISANLNNALSSAGAKKVLDQLADQELIMRKEWGKQRMYGPLQVSQSDQG
jgi:hypothetical protein